MVTVETIHKLPMDELTFMRMEAQDEGFCLLEHLVTEFQQGANRFDRPKEVLLIVRLSGTVVGIGGLNLDPYFDESRIGRIRYLYVLRQLRRMGIGRRLVQRLIAEAVGFFDTLCVSTDRQEVARFYESLGFLAVASKTATHWLYLEGYRGNTECSDGSV